MSRIRAFKQVANTSEETVKLQQRLSEFFTPIQSCALIDGVLLTSVTLTTGSTNQVAHKLDRDPLGWIVVRNRADSRIWDSQDSNTFKSRTLALECSANTVVDIWVF